MEFTYLVFTSLVFKILFQLQILASRKMVGFRPADVPPTAAVKFIGAGTAACIADLVTFPLDTAKVRLQVRVYKMKRFPATEPDGILLRKHGFP